MYGNGYAVLKHLLTLKRTMGVKKCFPIEQPQSPSSGLPPELLIKIFNHLSFYDLQNARLVCKSWADISRLADKQKNSVFRLTKHNWKEVFQGSRDPAVIQDLMRNLYLENITFNGKIIAFLTEYGDCVRTLCVNRIARLPFSMQQKLFNLRELHLISISRVPTQTANLGPVNLSNFPQLNSFKYTNREFIIASTTQEIKVPLLKQLVDPGNKWHLTCLKLQIKQDDNEALTLQVLETYSESLTHLDLECYYSTKLVLSQWTHQFQFLKKLQVLKLNGDFKQNFILKILQSLPVEAPIEHLDLSGNIEMEDESLLVILEKWPKSLQKLNLLFCTRITDASAIKLNVCHANLRRLNLLHCNAITSFGLIYGIGSQLNHYLRELYIGDIDNLDERCIRILAQNLPSLEHFYLSNCSNAVTNRALSHIFRHQTKLQTLDLDHCHNINDNGILGKGCNGGYDIQRLRCLHSLNLHGCRNITDQSLIKGLKFPELHTLKLGYCPKITVVGIDSLVENCPMIRTLVITSCPTIDDEAIVPIVTKLKRLRSLNVSNCDNLTESSIKYIIRTSNSLVELTICGIDCLKEPSIMKRLKLLKSSVTLNVDENDTIQSFD